MLSIPPATTTLASPLRISSAPRLTAFKDDAQTLLTVRAGTLVGSPALIAAWRAGICPMPAVITVPMMTCSTSAPSTLDRSSTSLMTAAPRSGALSVESLPPSLPNGVRAAATITTSSTKFILEALHRRPKSRTYTWPRMSAADPTGAASAADDLKARTEAARAGGSARYAEKLREQHKLPARRRLELLLDPDFVIEDGLLAHSDEAGFGADGVVTVIGQIDGRTVCVMANDPTVKAGSWGPRTVEKIVRIQETAERLRVPIFYLVDSAGARITEQVQMFPGRRHAGRIFYQEVHLSGVVPQICLLFGPSAAGGAYIPAFCDITIMVEGNASMYLGSPRMAEMVIGEKVTLEEMGGARMHATVSGLCDLLVASDEDAIAAGRRYLSYFPQNWTEAPGVGPTGVARPPVPLETLVPA